MSPIKEKRDLGLTAHRALQWVNSIAAIVVAWVVTTNLGEWKRVTEQAIRMESVPGDVRAIRDNVDVIRTTVQAHEWRLSAIEKSQP